MGNTIDTSKPMSETRQMSGRRVIKSSVTEITKGNVVDVLRKALGTHDLNRSEIQYLWDYYRGKQPILNRVKTVRPEICNRIVENRANEIVSFKVGYLCGEPIQYIARDSDEQTSEQITLLNELMFAEDKSAKDQEIVEWQMICGTSYRLVLPDPVGEEDSSPFELFTLDPRNSFIVYSSDIGNKPLMGVKYYTDDDEVTRYSVYTDKECFYIENELVRETKPHALGMIPIIEYPANNARLGSFEIVLPLLDAINNVESNRLDGMEQMIQAFIKFINCDISTEGFNELKELGAIKVKSVDGTNADVDIVSNDLNQDQSQTLKEDLYNAILTICGMPNRNGGTSTSDTGSAVLLRDGWSLAEARAKDSEHMFKRSEKQMLKVVLRICRDFSNLTLKLSDISLKFTRRNYENIQMKAQVLDMLLKNPKVHPLLAYESAGMFIDPESAYSMSMKYYEDVQKQMMEQQAQSESIEPTDNNEE